MFYTELQDILPSIIHQLGMCVGFFWSSVFGDSCSSRPKHIEYENAGPDNLENLKKLAEQFQKQAPEAGAGSTTAQEENDDDVPELVPGETFETAAEETKDS